MSDPMPVFIIKAKDNLAPGVIAQYVRACVDQGLHNQARSVIDSLEEVNAWRERNPGLCKWPDHAHVPAGEPGSGSER